MTLLGEPELGAQNIAKAYELRDRVSDRENFFITFNYYRQVPRNLELARQTLESWTQKYPAISSRTPFLGLHRARVGHHERAVEEGLKAIELDPKFTIGYINAAFAYLYLNRLADAEALLRKASERDRSREFSQFRYFIAFLRNDKAAMEREITQRPAKVQAQGRFEHQEAMTSAYHGRIKEADRLSESAVIWLARGVCRSGPRCSKALVQCGTHCSGFGKRRKEARRRRCHFTEAGTPTMDPPLRWRSPGVRTSSQYRGRPRKALPGGHLGPVQLPARAAGARRSQPG